MLQFPKIQIYRLKYVCLSKIPQLPPSGLNRVEDFLMRVLGRSRSALDGLSAAARIERAVLPLIWPSPLPESNRIVHREPHSGGMQRLGTATSLDFKP